MLYRLEVEGCLNYRVNSLATVAMIHELMIVTVIRILGIHWDLAIYHEQMRDSDRCNVL
jgi:hypothetical protein